MNECITEELLEKYQDLFIKYENIINEYFRDNSKKIHKTVDLVLNNLHFHDVDKTDYYSLANEIFITEVLTNYDSKQDFVKFLKTCLYKKFCTYMTRTNRDKRINVIKVPKKDENGEIMLDNNGNIVIERVKITDVSIHTPIGDDENLTIGDAVAGKETIESQFFGENKEAYSKEMSEYLSRLSTLQQNVLYLISIGFTPNEIIGELHINKKMYEDCYSAIHSYRNISILM